MTTGAPLGPLYGAPAMSILKTLLGSSTGAEVAVGVGVGEGGGGARRASEAVRLLCTVARSFPAFRSWTTPCASARLLEHFSGSLTRHSERVIPQPQLQRVPSRICRAVVTCSF